VLQQKRTREKLHIFGGFMVLFSEWLQENKLAKVLLGAATAAAPLGFLISPNNPSTVEPEVTYNLVVQDKPDALYYQVQFNNINFDKNDMPSLIRRYKKEAQDAVIDKILDDNGITFKVGGFPIRTAGLNKLSFEKLDSRRDKGTLNIVLRQAKVPE